MNDQLFKKTASQYRNEKLCLTCAQKSETKEAVLVLKEERANEVVEQKFYCFIHIQTK